eukprot:gene802-178_t
MSGGWIEAARQDPLAQPSAAGYLEDDVDALPEGWGKLTLSPGPDYTVGGPEFHDSPSPRSIGSSDSDETEGCEGYRSASSDEQPEKNNSSFTFPRKSSWGDFSESIIPKTSNENDLAGAPSAWEKWKESWQKTPPKGEQIKDESKKELSEPEPEDKNRKGPAWFERAPRPYSSSPQKFSKEKVERPTEQMQTPEEILLQRAKAKYKATGDLMALTDEEYNVYHATWGNSITPPAGDGPMSIEDSKKLWYIMVKHGMRRLPSYGPLPDGSIWCDHCDTFVTRHEEHGTSLIVEHMHSEYHRFKLSAENFMQSLEKDNVYPPFMSPSAKHGMGWAYCSLCEEDVRDDAIETHFFSKWHQKYWSRQAYVGALPPYIYYDPDSKTGNYFFCEVCNNFGCSTMAQVFVHIEVESHRQAVKEMIRQWDRSRLRDASSIFPDRPELKTFCFGCKTAFSNSGEALFHPCKPSYFKFGNSPYCRPCTMPPKPVKRLQALQKPIASSSSAPAEAVPSSLS